MSKEIKILHIAQHITGKADGIFTHLLMLFKNTSNNFQHILYFDGQEEAIKKLNNLPILFYTSNSLNKKLPLKFIKEIFRIIKEHKIDVIQTHSTKSYIIIGLLNIFLKRKHIFNYNGIFIFNKYYNQLEKLVLYILHITSYISKSCNLVIAPSKKSIEVLKRESSLFRDFRFYYNCAVSQDELQINEFVLHNILYMKQSSFLIGIISRIEIQKRIDVALKLVHYLKNKISDIFFIFIGDGPLLDEMITLSKKLNVSDKVLFLNYIPNAKNYIKYFDLLLFTSEWEGFPLTIWEAMKESVPIVSSYVGGIKEILEGENCGIVYPFGNIEKCAEIIIDLYNDREKLRQLGMNGYKAMIEKYNSENFKEFFENLYSELVNEK